jgi:hypothetical protein
MLIAQEPATLGVFRLRQGRLLAPVHIMLAVFACVANAFPLRRHRAHADRAMRLHALGAP